jgi:hypothetical protein
MRVGKLNKWVPKKWKPEYERIVGLSCLGESNKKIAQMMGFTPEHVSTILNLPQAEELRELVLSKLREKNVESATEVLGRIGIKTAVLLEKAIDNKQFTENPKTMFALIDRGLDVLRGTGLLRTTGVSGSAGVAAQNALVLQGDAADRFVEGMIKADESKRIHGNLSLVKAAGE